MRTIRLRWADDRLHCDDADRPCPADELANLHRSLTAQLNANFWSLAALERVGDQLGQWLGDWCPKKGVRLEIAGHDALVHLPWEALRVKGRFLAKRNPSYMPIRRVDDGRQPMKPPEPSPYDLAVLFMAASPNDQAHRLSYEDEEHRIERALGETVPIVDVVETGDLAGLNEKLATMNDWSVIHLSAHGQRHPPALCLEDINGATELVEADDFELSDRGQRLVVLASCASTQAGPDLQPSLAAELVDREAAPCVVGFGAKVGDEAATCMAEHFYARLSLGDSIESALAFARRQLLSDGIEDHRAWAALRQFAAVDGGGPVTVPSRTRDPRPWSTVDRQALARARHSAPHLPIAMPGRFVGRRTQLRQVITALGPYSVGALLTGVGGIGKSSLAARALQRRSELRPIVMFRDFRIRALFEALRSAFPADAAVQAALDADALMRAENPASEALRLSIAQALRSNAVRSSPLVFVFDDLESGMEEDGTQWRLKTEPKRVLQAVLELLSGPSPSRNRILMTGRYGVRLGDRQGRDLLRAVVRVPLCAPSRDEQVRLLRQADRFTEDGTPRQEYGVEPVDATRAVELAGHNPRLLSRLHAVLLTGHGEDLLSKLEAHFDRRGPVPEKLNAVFEQLIIDRLLELAGPSGRAILSGLAIFPIRVPRAAAADAVTCSADELNRLIGLTLVEVDPEDLIGIPPIMRGQIDPCDDDTAALLLNRLLDALPGAWLPDAEGVWSGPRERADFLFHAAANVTPPRSNLAGPAGAALVDALLSANEYPAARALTKSVNRLDPHPRLLSRLFDAWWGTDTHRARALIERARDALTADADPELRVKVLRCEAEVFERSGELAAALGRLDDARQYTNTESTAATLTGERARLVNRLGQVDEALTLHLEELSVYEALGDTRSRAVTLGDIARIKKSKGQVDEALTLHLEKLGICEALGDTRSRSVTLWDLSQIYATLGRGREQREAVAEAFQIAELLGDTMGCLFVGRQHAINLIDAGKTGQAVQPLRRVREAARLLGREADEAWAKAQLLELEADD